MTSIEYSTWRHLMFQWRLFFILTFLKQVLVTSGRASWPDGVCFFVVLFFVPALICLTALYQFLSPLKSHKSLFKIEETKQTWWSQWAWWLLRHSVHQGLEEEEEKGGRGRAGVWEFSHLEKACGAVLTSDGCVCVLCNFSIFQWSHAEKVSVVTNSLE